MLTLLHNLTFVLHSHFFFFIPGQFVYWNETRDFLALNNTKSCRFFREALRFQVLLHILLCGLALAHFYYVKGFCENELTLPLLWGGVIFFFGFEFVFNTSFFRSRQKSIASLNMLLQPGKVRTICGISRNKPF